MGHRHHRDSVKFPLAHSFFIVCSFCETSVNSVAVCVCALHV